MPPMVMEHEEDPRQKILEALGDLSGVEIFNNQVLVAVYSKGAGLYSAWNIDLV